ncbi:alkaline phosphatase family protein [Flaviflexus equikiangi]|uniref:Alkaline phosphatase family protein n=1 Tax=Flaviflexus equikiangi TaxID=2758573 RepID=A0ABS2TIB7_9ACTO|nr:nucleotide pyrophosphatase/phosphodiesterase family protein [Flaviflexus equikiangi]MBM9433286.1 alkaline phosphatase family protein [Flaviflexus equikiangi]
MTIPPRLTDVLAGAAGVLGYDLDGLDPVASRARLALPGASKAIVVLVDGLGFHNLSARSGHAPFLRRRMAERPDPIRTVSPSTTAAAVTALGTGLPPGQTAMAGYSLRDPGTGEPFNLISWNTSLRAEDWQRQRTIGELLAMSGRDMAVVQPAKFLGSGLTNAAWRGGIPVVGESLEDRVDGALRALTRSDLVYLYWGELDHVGHSRGWQSESWTAELELLDAQLADLARRAPADTLLVITADHGMIDVEERIDVAAIPALSEGVVLVAGEERAAQVYTDEPEALAGRWRDYLGDRALVLTKSEWIASGMLGDVTEQTASAIGDVVAFASGRLGIGDSRFMSAGALSIRGLHGSLTEEEMAVPCLVEVTS